MAKNIIQARASKIPVKTLAAIDGEGPPVIISPAEAKNFDIVSAVGDLTPAGRIAVWLSGTTT
jgi:hypothetical protein